MSGHSKWSQIKRKKSATDEKRGRMFGKLLRAIEVAAREGGPSIEGNMTQAAMDLGATPWQAFWYVSWPLTRPGLWAGCALVFIPVGLLVFATALALRHHARAAHRAQSWPAATPPRTAAGSGP